MEFHAFHGCKPEERTNGNTFMVDFYAERDVDDAAKSDDIKDTTDCDAIYEVIAGEMKKPSNLLENVCARIVEALHENFKELDLIKVTVAKKNPPLSGPCEWSKVTMRYVKVRYSNTITLNK